MWRKGGCGEWWKASVKLLCIIIGTGRFGVSSPVVNAGNAHPCARQLTRPSMDACTLILSTCPVPLLCVQFKVSFPPSPTTSLSPHFSNSGQSSFPLLHLSGLVRLSAASLKGCTTTLLSIKIHGRGFATSHEYSASATPSVRQ